MARAPQATLQALNIGMLTALKAPKLLGNYSHLMRQDEHYAATTAILQNFQADLRKLSVSLLCYDTHSCCWVASSSHC